MSFATKHKKGGIDWGVNSEGYSFYKREDLYKENADTAHTLKGLYLNKKSNFGIHPVAICDGYFVDLPDYMNDEIKAILADETDIADIKAGKVGFKINTFTDEKFKRTCYGIEWVDLLEK